MFIGHFGVAFAAKKIVPNVSLGTLFLSVEFLDLIWPIFLLLGWEHVRIVHGITKVSPFDFYDYPISHSLLGVFAWSLAFAGIYFALLGRRRAAIVLGIAVASHWLLDLVTHRPDLPLWPGGPKVGLGLWNSWAASISIEALLFGVGLLVYVRHTEAWDSIGRYAFWALAAFLLLGWVGSLVAGAPPNTTALAWGGLMLWLIVPWGWWVDSHRKARQRI